MGSALTRHLRDLGDVGGFEELNGSLPSAAIPISDSRTQISPGSCTATPTANKPIHVLDLDPRSPTAEIVRTPIDVSVKFSQRFQDSPKTPILQSRRSYLETDLDSLSTSEILEVSDKIIEHDSSLPLGLSNAHLTKLRFLGFDPRSPSSDVVRTPIQIGTKTRGLSPIHFDDTLSVGSVSSHDIFSNSICSSEFTRDCSDPSALVSENEDISDREDDDSNTNSAEALNFKALADDHLKESTGVDSPNLPKEKCTQNVEGLTTIVSKLQVYQEDGLRTDADEKGSTVTPETKKPNGNRSRTPLTPICNRNNRTPNSILRGKQSQKIEKEILTKAKIYSMDDNVLTPPKVKSIGSSRKENVLNGHPSRRRCAGNNEKVPLSESKKRPLAQWDQDSSVII